MPSDCNALANELFAGIAPGYDRWAQLFSLFQYRRWRARLVGALKPRPGEHILDVSTGSGAVALDLARRGCVVVGLDQSREMLREALRRKSALPPAFSVQLVEGQAESLPFPAGSFDAVTFTFLLRYVADPLLPVTEILRVLRHGGRVAMLEFAVPRGSVTALLWSLYANPLLPLLSRPVSPGWARVGSFLGGSIADYYRRYPLDDLIRDWSRLGFRDLHHELLSAGGAVIIRGVKA